MVVTKPASLVLNSYENWVARDAWTRFLRYFNWNHFFRDFPAISFQAANSLLISFSSMSTTS
jgi:hypothetical protein